MNKLNYRLGAGLLPRDVGLVIEDRFYRSVMIGERQREWEGVKDLLEGVDIRLIQPVPVWKAVTSSFCRVPLQWA